MLKAEFMKWRFRFGIIKLIGFNWDIIAYEQQFNAKREINFFSRWRVTRYPKVTSTPGVSKTQTSKTQTSDPKNSDPLGVSKTQTLKIKQLNNKEPRMAISRAERGYVHLSMCTEGIKAFLKRTRRCSVDGRKRYENDKRGRKSF